MGLSGGQKTAIGIGAAAVIGLIGWLTKPLWAPAVKKAVKGPLADCNKSFLFVGDSLTAYTQSYADQLRSVCPQFNYKKAAKSGEKTDWMLTQLTAALASSKPDVVVIWGGVNDIYARNSIVAAKQNLQAMYDLAKRSGAKVVALTVIPTRTYKNATDKTVSLTNELNSWIKGNLTLDGMADANKAVNNGNDGTRSEFLQSDTLHLTSAGQYAVMDATRKVLF